MGRLTRILLWVVLGAFVFGAGLGIFGLFNSYSRDSGKFFGVMMSVLLFGLTALGSAVVLEKGRWPRTMKLSLGVSAFGLVVFVAAIFAEPRDSEVGKFMLILAETAVLMPYLGLMALTRLNGWRLTVKLGTMLLAGLTAVYVASLVVADPGYAMTRRYLLWEIFGMLLILTGLMSVVTPVLHWIYGTKLEQAAESTRLELKVTCPRCETAQTIPNGKSACQVCGLKFELRVEEPRCECGYLLFKLERPLCPECGRPVEVPGALSGAFTVQPHRPPVSSV